MDTNQNSKEIIYNIKNIKSYFNNATKIFPKRKSDDVTGKPNLLLPIKSTSSNADTSTGSEKKTIAKKKIFPETVMNNPKPKKICIKFVDLVVEEKKDGDSDKHLELALQIKKRKYSSFSKIKITKCDQIFLDNNKEKGKEKEDIKNKKQLRKKSNKSMNIVILGNQKEENIIIKKIKKKLLCC